MASSPRSGPKPSLSVLPPSASTSSLADLPPIAALFLIDFDVKAGYTIAWKRADPGLELDNRVEYKSLPSGLHTVTDDLIYFVHAGTHAGLSAFVNEPCDEEDARNARMIAVGILVPLSYGRLGRAWRHAEALKDMAAKLVVDRTKTGILEDYWGSNQSSQVDADAVRSPNLPSSPTQERKPHNRNRSISDGTSLVPPEHKLSPYHPAWSLTSLLDKFGPLIFPIHRAALLRKRILISCHAPVHQACDFVYDLSILSNIPLSISDSLPPTAPSSRLRPLFTIGVHDIPFLMEDLAAANSPDESSEDESGSGWIACTTDSILAMKDTLWDMLITLPPEHAANAKEKAWPVVECPRGKPVKATQRDFRRFNALRAGLERLAALAAAPEPESPQSESEPAARLSTSHSGRMLYNNAVDDASDKLVEPSSWTSLAYNGFMWWASAGEQIRSEEQEESARDSALLADLASDGPAMTMPPTPRQLDINNSIASLVDRRATEDGKARIELAIIAYFHRLTTQMLSVLVDVVDSTDGAYPDTIENRDGEGEDTDESEVLLRNGLEGSDMGSIMLDSRSVENMGLDVWSASDALFVQEMVDLYFDRSARVEGKGVEVCGVRVC